MTSLQRTAEEAKADHIAGMGDEIGAIYSALWQEVAWIHTKWEAYVELFGTSPERIALLNDAAPSFFRIIQDSLLEDVLLHIARLTYSPKSMGKENLSLRRLGQAVESISIAQDIKGLIANVLKATEFVRDWRNRKLAHGDLSIALDTSVQSLAPASRAAVNEALIAITAVMNAIAAHYLDSTTMFDAGGESGGAVSLLYVVRDGLHYKQDRQDRISRGEYRPEDIHPDPL